MLPRPETQPVRPRLEAASPETGDRSNGPLRLIYVLLSPTFGMHQYTADLANRTAAAGYRTDLITTARCPRDRYAPTIQIHTPLTSTTTGFSSEAVDVNAYRRVQAALSNLAAGCSPVVVHVTGVHLWNLSLVRGMRRRGVAVVHTLHDLDPHEERRFGSLIRVWNRLLVRSGCHLLVHGRCYRQRLLAQNVARERVTQTPLLHLFLGHRAMCVVKAQAGRVCHEPWGLFFGRLERYKGVDTLIQAQGLLGDHDHGLILAGSGALSNVWDRSLPPGVDVRPGHIEDWEALHLFRHCGLVVLPYRDATQSALIAAAYYFRKPVIVTDVGALPEYVEPGRTGWIVEPEDPIALADRLRDALSDPGRLARLGEQARAWYERSRRREWETLVQMYESGSRAHGERS